MKMSINVGRSWFNKSNCPQPGNPDNPQPLSPAEKFAGLLFYLLLFQSAFAKRSLTKCCILASSSGDHSEALKVQPNECRHSSIMVSASFSGQMFLPESSSIPGNEGVYLLWASKIPPCWITLLFFFRCALPTILCLLMIRSCGA